MVVHLEHIKVKFEHQGHWVKVKFTFVKLIIRTVGHQILSLNQLLILILAPQSTPDKSRYLNISCKI